MPPDEVSSDKPLVPRREMPVRGARGTGIQTFFALGAQRGGSERGALQVIYALQASGQRVYVGQHLDVCIEGPSRSKGT